MVRSPCCENNGSNLKKGPWTPEEDEKLANYIHKYGEGTWRTLPKRAGLNRCGKSCRLRWNNYLKPDIKRGTFSDEEERLIVELHSILGNKWSKIATHLLGRTDNEIKNHWNTKLRRKLLKVGIDPQTNKPVAPDINQLGHYSELLSALNPAGNLMNVWTNALLSRVDATQLAKLQLLQNLLVAVNFAGPGTNNLVPSSMFTNQAVGVGSTDLLLPTLQSAAGQMLPGNFLGIPKAVTPSPQNDNLNNFHNTNRYHAEDSVPALYEVSSTSTPETFINMDQMNALQNPLIDTFETWEDLVDQEDFWKDLLA